ncbi:MAG: hypothetical protein GC199_09090 [Alphaproteobacteria bacterium]|nr:hypothetical protein [Alphaproteobacteria bacterium]
MMDQPSALEIVSAVREFIEKRVMPKLEGHDAFHARVAANALGIVARELEHGPRATEDERARLRALLGVDGTLEELNRLLCERIGAGALTLETPGLAEHLRATTLAKVAIDQPSYSGLRAALKD